MWDKQLDSLEFSYATLMTAKEDGFEEGLEKGLSRDEKKVERKGLRTLPVIF
ncbi:TPA: hypothetical protein ACGO35_001247 [Streptococcus suis]